MSKEINKEQTNTLLSCPICDGEIKQMFMNEEIFTDCVWDESIGNVSTWFKCYRCDSEFFHDEPINTPEKQAEWWNTRKPMQNIVERLEALTEKAMSNSEKAAELGQAYEKHMIFNGARGNAFEEAIEIVKEEGGVYNNT